MFSRGYTSAMDRIKRVENSKTDRIQRVMRPKTDGIQRFATIWPRRPHPHASHDAAGDGRSSGKVALRGRFHPVPVPRTGPCTENGPMRQENRKVGPAGRRRNPVAPVHVKSTCYFAKPLYTGPHAGTFGAPTSRFSCRNLPDFVTRRPDAASKVRSARYRPSFALFRRGALA